MKDEPKHLQGVPRNLLIERIVELEEEIEEAWKEVAKVEAMPGVEGYPVRGGPLWEAIEVLRLQLKQKLATAREDVLEELAKENEPRVHGDYTPYIMFLDEQPDLCDCVHARKSRPKMAEKTKGDRIAQEVRGQSYARKRGAPRRFFCRTCGKTEESENVPSGWYSIARHNGLRGLARLGIYCSAACVSDQMPRLEGIERDIEGKS